MMLILLSVENFANAMRDGRETDEAPRMGSRSALITRLTLFLAGMGVVGMRAPTHNTLIKSKADQETDRSVKMLKTSVLTLIHQDLEHSLPRVAWAAIPRPFLNSKDESLARFIDTYALSGSKKMPVTDFGDEKTKEFLAGFDIHSISRIFHAYGESLYFVAATHSGAEVGFQDQGSFRVHQLKNPEVMSPLAIEGRNKVFVQNIAKLYRLAEKNGIPLKVSIGMDHVSGIIKLLIDGTQGKLRLHIRPSAREIRLGIDEFLQQQRNY